VEPVTLPTYAHLLFKLISLRLLLASAEIPFSGDVISMPINHLLVVYQLLLEVASKFMMVTQVLVDQLFMVISQLIQWLTHHGQIFIEIMMVLVEAPTEQLWKLNVQQLV
jgi:hypothetical protein